MTELQADELTQDRADLLSESGPEVSDPLEALRLLAALAEEGDDLLAEALAERARGSRETRRVPPPTRVRLGPRSRQVPALRGRRRGRDPGVADRRGGPDHRRGCGGRVATLGRDGPVS
ncbi:hypothetical protein GCM10020000_74510 [Streptomyces olivoverticillatus]